MDGWMDGCMDGLIKCIFLRQNIISYQTDIPFVSICAQQTSLFLQATTNIIMPNEAI